MNNDRGYINRCSMICTIHINFHHQSKPGDLLIIKYIFVPGLSQPSSGVVITY
jgi:hypothetical protein